MNKTENKDRRDLYLKIRVNREELEAIDRKFRNSGMKSRSEFVRAMIFEGYIVQFNEDKQYQECSMFLQKRFRKKNAAAIDEYEEADKYITEHIKDYLWTVKHPSGASWSKCSST